MPPLGYRLGNYNKILHTHGIVAQHWQGPRHRKKEALKIPNAIKEHNGGNPWEPSGEIGQALQLSLCHSSIATRLPRTHELLYDDPKVICVPKRFSFSFDRNAEPAQ
jgi:hypothetical protein